MKQSEVRDRAFAMPLTSPAYPPGPYRFVNREFLNITYRTDPEKLRASCRSRSRSRRRWSNTSSSACRIPPVSATTRKADRSSRSRFAAARAATAIACSSTIFRRWQVAGSCGASRRSSRVPSLRAETDTLVGTLDYGPVRVATGTMGYKYREADLAAIKNALSAPNYLLKIIPHVDGSPRICELVEYYLEDIQLKGAWTGPGALSLTPHALAPVAELPVLEVVSAVHIVADLTLGLGKVVHDYLR